MPKAITSSPEPKGPEPLSEINELVEPDSLPRELPHDKPDRAFARIADAALEVWPSARPNDQNRTIDGCWVGARDTVFHVRLSYDAGHDTTCLSRRFACFPDACRPKHILQFCNEANARHAGVQFTYVHETRQVCIRATCPYTPIDMVLVAHLRTLRLNVKRVLESGLLYEGLSPIGGRLCIDGPPFIGNLSTHDLD